MKKEKEKKKRKGKTEEKKRTKHVDNPKCWPTDDSGRAWEYP